MRTLIFLLLGLVPAWTQDLKPKYGPGDRVITDFFQKSANFFVLRDADQTFNEKGESTPRFHQIPGGVTLNILEAPTSRTGVYRVEIVAPKNALNLPSNHQFFVNVEQLENQTFGKDRTEEIVKEIDKINLLPNELLQGLSEYMELCQISPPPGVKIPEPTQPAMTYGKCRNNGYLETSSREMRLGKMDFLQDFPPECTYWALDRSVGSRFIKCPGGSREVKPCLSQAYHRVVHNAFVSMARCASINPYELFPMLEHESTMHPNILARGDGAARGISQIRPEWIRTANKGYLQSIIDRVKHASNLEKEELGADFASAPAESRVCTDNFERTLKDQRIQPSSRCSAVAFPHNPLLNLAYGLAQYSLSKTKALLEVFLTSFDDPEYSWLRESKRMKPALDELRADFEKMKAHRSVLENSTDPNELYRANLAIFSLENEALPKALRLFDVLDSGTNAILTEVAYYAFNGGQVGIPDAFRVFLKTRRRQDPETFSEQFRKFLGDPMDKPLETRNYVDNIKRDIAGVEKSAGVKCSKF